MSGDPMPRPYSQDLPHKSNAGAAHATIKLAVSTSARWRGRVTGARLGRKTLGMGLRKSWGQLGGGDASGFLVEVDDDGQTA